MVRFCRSVFQLIRWLFFVGLTIVSFVVGLFLTLLIAQISRDRRRTFFLAGKYWSRLLLWGAGIRLVIHHLEKLPSHGKGLIFVANHQGDIDILVLLAALPLPFLFIIKKELFRIPVFGWYLRQAGYLAIDRQDREKADGTISEAVHLLKKGENILIFPEGTRTRTGQVGYFKRGAFSLAAAAQAYLVPMAISGSFAVKQKGSLWITPGEVHLHILDPIRSAGDRDDRGSQKTLAHQVQSLIASHIKNK